MKRANMNIPEAKIDWMIRQNEMFPSNDKQENIKQEIEQAKKQGLLSQIFLSYITKTK